MLCDGDDDDSFAQFCPTEENCKKERKIKGERTLVRRVVGIL